MIKILIIENEFASIKDPIDALAALYDGNLSYNLVPTSQQIDWNNLNNYNVIFVDISLAPRTNLDGFGILKKIKESYPKILNRVAVITANHVIEQDMKEKGFTQKEFEIFQKPLKFMDLYNFINKANH